MIFDKCLKDAMKQHHFESIGVIGIAGHDLYQVFKCTKCHDAVVEKLKIII